MPFDKLNAAALDKHAGATINDTELDHNNSGVLVYEVELTDTAGKQFEVKLDAKTGAVLADKLDAGRISQKRATFGWRVLCATPNRHITVIPPCNDSRLSAYETSYRPFPCEPP